MVPGGSSAGDFHIVIHGVVEIVDGCTLNDRGAASEIVSVSLYLSSTNFMSKTQKVSEHIIAGIAQRATSE